MIAFYHIFLAERLWPVSKAYSKLINVYLDNPQTRIFKYRVLGQDYLVLGDLNVYIGRFPESDSFVLEGVISFLLPESIDNPGRLSRLSQYLCSSRLGLRNTVPDRRTMWRLYKCLK